MHDANFHYRTAADLAQSIRRRELSPVELIEATLARIERSQPLLNAFITVCHDQARAAARAAEAAVLRDDPLGALHGIPFSVKDLIKTQGVRTTYGSMIFHDYVPAEDAVAVARLKAAGAILIGKTTTPEFGQKGITEAPLFGRTRNAWHAARTSGGSSGGAAVALAAGLGPLAVGTDGGGSTRIPAACNGVVGFKQSLGLVPHDSAEDAFGNISYVTPMARTVMDTALMLEAMAGPHASDPHTQNRPLQRLVEAARGEGDLKGLKIGWRPLLGNTVVAAQVRDLCAGAMHAFAELGAEIVEMPDDFEHAEQLWLTLNGSLPFCPVRPPSRAASGRDGPEPGRAARTGRRLFGPGVVSGDLHAHPAVPAGARLVRASRHRRDADACQNCAADRSRLLRCGGDRRPPRGYHAPGLVPLYAAVQPHRQSGDQHSLWLGQRRAAGGPAADRPAWARMRCSCALPRGSRSCDLGQIERPLCPSSTDLYLPSSFSIHSLPTLRSLIIALVAASNSRKWGVFRCAANAASSL